MGDKTAIEWTDATWNPIAGCSIVSPGCTNCYAMTMAARIERMVEKSVAGGSTHYKGTTQVVNSNTVWTGKVVLAPEHIITAPLRWKKPRRIFVNSMGDLFHEDVPDVWIDRVFSIMARSPQHTFQVLTKRSNRMWTYTSNLPKRRSELDCDSGLDCCDWPLPNVWLGVSAEDQKRAEERIPDLLATPAAIRFVSAEPLLGEIDFCAIDATDGNTQEINSLTGEIWFPGNAGESSRTFFGNSLDWIIVGGESGPNARPMHPDWARSIRDQCKAAGVPFFFKQWGEWMCADQPGADLLGSVKTPIHDWKDGHHSMRVGKRVAGDLLDGVRHHELPSSYSGATSTPSPSAVPESSSNVAAGGGTTEGS